MFREPPLRGHRVRLLADSDWFNPAPGMELLVYGKECVGVGGKGRTGVGVLRSWCEKGVSSPVRVVDLEMGRHKCC
jgi:hypothetical protein